MTHWLTGLLHLKTCIYFALFSFHANMKFWIYIASCSKNSSVSFNCQELSLWTDWYILSHYSTLLQYHMFRSCKPNFLGAIASLASMTPVIKVIVREEEHWQTPVAELLWIYDLQYRDSVQLVRIMVQILFCWCWSLNLKACASCVLFCWWQVAINLTKAV